MLETRETILILDKDSHTRWILKALLENEKYFVISVDTIGRAMENLSDKVSGFITEYLIDQSNTLETIRELKKKIPGAYVMMLTDNLVDEREYEEIINAGVDDYFTKPMSSQRVLIHLRKGLRQRSLLLHKSEAPRPKGRSFPAR